MVGGSELAFRLLARRHGAQLCYTPMMHADRFVEPCFVAGPRGVGPLRTQPDDAPLVAHFCGNDPATLLAAGKRAERYCVAVDLNLGCPQRSAHSGRYGSFLADEVDRPLVLEIVATLARGLRVPVFCKIRLQDEPEETLRYARQLQQAGCALLAVHGRVRGDPLHRRKGPADLRQVAAVKAALRIPVLTNGNVRDAGELLASLSTTKADGVMSAEGALDDPAIFARAAVRAA
jgi:tRNA-dihydrouridine synthase 1